MPAPFMRRSGSEYHPGMLLVKMKASPAGRIASYTSAHPDLPRASSPQDLIGHGTHVAGTIAARINNNLGINGICRCKLLG